MDEISPTFFPTETYSLHWNGTAWSVVPMPLVGSSNVNAFFHLNAIQVNSPTDVWAVGNRGARRHHHEQHADRALERDGVEHRAQPVPGLGRQPGRGDHQQRGQRRVGGGD